MSDRGHILLVEDEAGTRGATEALLRGAGLHVHAAESAEAALALLESVAPDAVVLDLGLPGMSGGELLAELGRRLRRVPVVVLTAHREAEVAVECMKAGAFDYLVKPAEDVRLLTTVANALRHRALTRSVASLEGLAGAAGPGLAGASPALRALADEVEVAAEGDRPVLIHGEPGTERAVAARLVHARSRRAAGPCLTIRCGLLTPAQQEEAIFGGEGGGGRLAEAASGSLYLEDVEALAPPAQERLVAALALAARGRSGGVPATDFRLIASTTADLPVLVRRRRFAADLYMRLAAAELHVPPLRARGEDLLALARQELAEVTGGDATLSRDAEAALLAHGWPGNLEELRQVLRRAVEASGGGLVAPRHLALGSPGAPATKPPASGGPGEGDALTLADRERQAILAALEQSAGDRTAASRALGVSRSTIYRKLKEYGLE